MNLRKKIGQKIKAQISFKKFLYAFTIICLSVTWILLLCAAVLSPLSPIYSQTIDSNPRAYAFGPMLTKDATQQMLNYVWFGQTYQILLSAQAVSHMSDVRDVFHNGQLLLLTLLLTCGVLLKITRRKVRMQLLHRGAVLSFVITLLSGLCVSLFFSHSFTFFHKMLFSNNDWLFPANDSLILLFPQDFFFKIALFLFGIILISSGIMVLFLRWLSRKNIN